MSLRLVQEFEGLNEQIFRIWGFLVNFAATKGKCFYMAVSNGGQGPPY